MFPVSVYGHQYPVYETSYYYVLRIFLPEGKQITLRSSGGCSIWTSTNQSLWFDGENYVVVSRERGGAPLAGEEIDRSRRGQTFPRGEYPYKKWKWTSDGSYFGIAIAEEGILKEGKLKKVNKPDLRTQEEADSWKKSPEIGAYRSLVVPCDPWR